MGRQRYFAGIYERRGEDRSYHAGTGLRIVIPSAACGDGACLHAGGRELCRICRNVPPALVGSGRFRHIKREKRNGRFPGDDGRLYVCLSALLPVYGLSQYGLPMLLYCVLRLRERDRSIRERLLYYAYVVFFGANSSLVLSGFAVLGIWAVWEIIAALRRKYSAAQGIAWILLLLTYLLENGALFLQIFGVGESTVSHKAEYALTAVSFWEQWKTNLLQGGQHSVDYHGWILLIAVFTVIAVIRRRAGDGKRIFRSLAISCGCIVFIATAAALWDSGIGVSLRSGWGALKGFQANRVLWLSPCLWYLRWDAAFAAAAAALRETVREECDPVHSYNDSHCDDSGRNSPSEQSETESAKDSEPGVRSHELPGLLCRRCTGSGAGIYL